MLSVASMSWKYFHWDVVHMPSAWTKLRVSGCIGVDFEQHCVPSLW